MKILVLSVTAGEGHNAIARAVVEELESRGIETKKVDIFENNKLQAFIANDLYIYACRYFKGFLTSSFHSLQKRNPEKKESMTIDSMVKPAQKHIFKEIDEFNPDAVFCTHLYCARLIGDYKKKNPDKNIKTFSILSDFTVHPYWETVVDMDYLFTPNAAFDDTLIYKGYRREQLVETGIPVSSKFAHEKDQKEIRRKLGLDENKTTLLIMNGGFGVGKSEKMLKKLDEIDADFQVIVVNGRNEKSKNKIDKMIEKGIFAKKILNLGYCTNVDELMSATDCILGKSGAISISESMNKRRPLIIINKPPAQEFDNMKFLTDNKASIYIDKPGKFAEILTKCLSDPKHFDELAENIETLRRPNAAKHAIDFMIHVLEDDKKQDA